MGYKVVREITPEEYMLFGNLGLPVYGNHRDLCSVGEIAYHDNDEAVSWARYCRFWSICYKYHYLLEKDPCIE